MTQMNHELLMRLLATAKTQGPAAIVKWSEVASEFIGAMDRCIRDLRIALREEQSMRMTAESTVRALESELAVLRSRGVPADEGSGKRPA